MFVGAKIGILCRINKLFSEKFGKYGKTYYLCNMNLIDWIYLIAFVTVAAAIVVIAWQWLKRRSDYVRLCERVHQHKDRYVFLIDRKFRVKETNFYELNADIPNNQPYVLGNVLHCQTAIDEGLCGTGIDCDTCPIRMVIKNAFKLKRNFDHIDAVIYQYDAHRKVNEVDVRVDGELVYVGKEPHFIVEAWNKNEQDTKQDSYDI